MINKIQRLKTEKSGKGVYGSYYKLTNSKGVKVLNVRFPSIKKLLLSKTYFKAHEEALKLKLGKERYSYIPKCYGVKIFKMGKHFKVGIVMQHLGNKTLDNFQHLNHDKIIKKILSALNKKRIDHSDLHTNNIMRYKNKWYVIDFGMVYFK